jgi:RHS repeat-associated protein
VEHVTASGTFYYLHDGLGSTIALVDSSGNVVQSYEYDAFGAVRSQSGNQPTEYQFAGQDTDPSGLQYLRARYYDPATGRFLSRDPKGGLNGYAYAGNDPVDNADPSGTQYYWGGFYSYFPAMYGFGYSPYTSYYSYSPYYGYSWYSPYSYGYSYSYYGGSSYYGPYSLSNYWRYSYALYDSCGGGFLGWVCGALWPQNQVNQCLTVAAYAGLGTALLGQPEGAPVAALIAGYGCSVANGGP